MSVSNALPLDSTDLPEAEAWYVDTPAYPAHVDVAAGMPLGAAPVSVEVEAGGADLEEAMVETPAQFRQASQKQLPLAFEYEFSRKIDLASGDDDAFLPVYSKPVPGTFFYFAVPEIENRAYLVCRTVPDQTLLESRLNIHFDGRFVGNTQLSEHEAGRDLMINLGPDRGVTVRKKKDKDKTSETYFGKVDRNTIAREVSYSIIIENSKDEPVRIQIEDAVPVTRKDRMQIKGTTLTPKPTRKDTDDREGVMVWDLTIKPGNKEKINIEFGIRYPRELEPFGI